MPPIRSFTVPGTGAPSLAIPATGLVDRPARFSSDEEPYMARKRGGTSRRSAGSKSSTTVNKTFTPAFNLKGRSSKRSNGKSR